MPRERRCQICGSIKLYKSVGGMVCDQGHVAAGYIREDNEIEGVSRHAMRLRKLHKAKKPKKRKGKLKSKAFVGIEADFLYWQCMQLILRKQIATLRKLWNLPPEFEIICRDLWLLNLSILERPPPAEPWKRMILGEHLNERWGDEEDTAATTSPDQDAGIHTGNTANNSSRAGPSDSGSDAEEESESQRAEIDDLLGELSDSGSEHSNISQQPEPETQKLKRKKRITVTEHPLKPSESPMVNIAILYAACCVMRIPVICMDFIQLINSYKVPYLDPTLLLPTDVVTYLNTAKRAALKREFAPSTEELYNVSKTLAKTSRYLHDLPFPDFNVAPLLWRAVWGMLGSPTLYVLVKGLIETVGPEFSFYTSRQVSRLAPEVTSVGATISTLKIIYGFDGRPRIAGEDDPALAMPTFEAYMTSLQKHWDARLDTEDELYSPMTTVPVTDLSDEQLDRYISFSSRALLPATDGSLESERRRNGTAHHVAKLFPIPSIPDVEEQKTSRMQPCLRHFRSVPTESLHPSGPGLQTPLQPGESTPIYDKRDFTGAFPHAYELVLNVAARWAGVSTEDVALVVTAFDRALVGKSRADMFSSYAARKKTAAEGASKLGSTGVGEDGGSEQDDDEGSVYE